MWKIGQRTLENVNDTLENTAPNKNSSSVAHMLMVKKDISATVDVTLDLEKVWILLWMYISERSQLCMIVGAVAKAALTAVTAGADGWHFSMWGAQKSQRKQTKKFSLCSKCSLIHQTHWSNGVFLRQALYGRKERSATISEYFLIDVLLYT